MKSPVWLALVLTVQLLWSLPLLLLGFGYSSEVRPLDAVVICAPLALVVVFGSAAIVQRRKGRYGLALAIALMPLLVLPVMLNVLAL